MTEEIPKLCKGCVNSYHFKDGSNCWFYWPNKKECVQKQWVKNDLENGL